LLLLQTWSLSHWQLLIGLPQLSTTAPQRPAHPVDSQQLGTVTCWSGKSHAPAAVQLDTFTVAPAVNCASEKTPGAL
jgi:hypothetical protein